MKVLVIAEFYPRAADPVLGVWAHRQALAARDAGAEVRVLVLHRLVPPRASFSRDGRGHTGGPLRALRTLAAQPHEQTLDGLPIAYVRYISPPRARSYPAWGAWASPALKRALARTRRSFDFDLIHAHNAVPAADAVRRALSGHIAAPHSATLPDQPASPCRPVPVSAAQWWVPRRASRARRVPLVVSVHGGDVLHTAPRSERGAEAVRRGLEATTTVLANSEGIAELAHAHGARDVRVVHLGADPPPARTAAAPARREQPPTLVTVGHLVARKRHADVLRALAVLAPRHPTLRYTIVGDGPERIALEGLAARLEIGARVEFRGQLPHAEAVATARACTLFAMPSTEEAFGVAYIEAMAAGVPAIGCRGEPGPEEIAAAGDGFVLVPPGDIERLTQRIDELLSDPQRLREAGLRARETVSANFTWEICGAQTLAAYEHACALQGALAQARS